MSPGSGPGIGSLLIHSFLRCRLEHLRLERSRLAGVASRYRQRYCERLAVRQQRVDSPEPGGELCHVFTTVRHITRHLAATVRIGG